MSYFEINYWVMLILSPLLVGVLGVLIERFCCAGSTSSIISMACC